MAELITLSGHYGRRSQISSRNDEIDELMGDFLDFLKSTGSMAISPFKAVGKGVGHTFMEAYRGAKKGDILKILKAPFKGIGHTFMTQVRDVKSHAEYFYRPSKMRHWMGPVGGIMTAAATAIPGPWSVVLIPLGIALSTGGGIAQGIYSKDRAKKATSEAEQAKALAGEKAKYIWYGVAGLGVVASIMMFR